MLERIENLEENITNLKKIKKQFNINDIKTNKLDEWALRYGIFESIQIIIDIACHITNKYNLGVAKTYTQCIENLTKYHYIEKNLEKNLISAIGLRNLLIHEYTKIDIEKLYSFLNLTSDFSKFIKNIKEYL